MRNAVLTVIFLSILKIAVFSAGLEFGYYSGSGLNCGVLSLQKDYYSSDLSFGAAINGNLSNKDISLESVVVKYLEYDDGTRGFRYAPLEDMSFGFGLLLNDFNTSYYQPVFFKNEQCGLRVYYDFDSFTLEGMGTYSHLYGIRLKDISIYNMDIGIEYLSDSDLLSSESFGRSACGAYIEIPLTDEFSIIGESAGTSNGGEGNMAGIAFDYDLIFAYSKINVGAVSFNDRFIPGYFTSGYDLDPVDFSSLEAPGERRYGTFSKLNTGLLGFLAFNLINEDYTDGGSATSGSFLLTPFERINIIGFVKELSFCDFRPVKGEDSNMIGGTVEYKFKSISISLNYKKTLVEGSLKPLEATYFQFGVNI